MRPDVLTLHRYYETVLGKQTAQVVSSKLASLLPLQENSITIGLGFCLPYLDELVLREPDGSTARSIAFMPERQGVCHWPSSGRSLSSLVNKYNLPLADSSVDNVLLVHALEHAHKPTHLLREVWRVLNPGGQVIVVVPNRLRSWSASESTPFGSGKPYSKSQLSRLMTEQMLSPVEWLTALMLPPAKIVGKARMLGVGEKLGSVFGKNFGGVLVMMARKNVYGAIPHKRGKMKAIPVLTRVREQ